MLTINQADLFYAAEYALEALLLLLCTWQRGTLDDPTTDRTKGFLPPSAAGAVCVRSGHRAYDGNIFYPA